MEKYRRSVILYLSGNKKYGKVWEPGSFGPVQTRSLLIRDHPWTSLSPHLVRGMRDGRAGASTGEAGCSVRGLEASLRSFPPPHKC